MNAVTNTNIETKPTSLRKKSSFRRENSYRIFHITKKPKEESDDDDDDDDNLNIKNKPENDFKIKSQRKSFKISNRHDLDGWKRKSTKNKRLLFLHKTSCESTSNEIKTPPLSYQFQSIISNDAATNQLLNKNEESSESDVLVEAINKTINHDDATLNDLLARANQLETTFQKQDFNKIQPIPRGSFQRKRKRFIIACSLVLIILTIIITIVIFVVVKTLRYKPQINQVSKASSIYDQHR